MIEKGVRHYWYNSMIEKGVRHVLYWYNSMIEKGVRHYCTCTDIIVW